VAICFILWPFGICCGHLLYYPHFGKLYQAKSGNPAATEREKKSESDEKPLFKKLYRKQNPLHPPKPDFNPKPD
jgi:hypothetical protein